MLVVVLVVVFVVVLVVVLAGMVLVKVVALEFDRQTHVLDLNMHHL